MTPTRSADRRSVLRAAAWTVPALTVSAAAPAFATSPPTDPGALAVTGHRTVSGTVVDTSFAGAPFATYLAGFYQTRWYAMNGGTNRSGSTSAKQGTVGTTPSHWNVLDPDDATSTRPTLEVQRNISVSKTVIQGTPAEGGNWFRYTSSLSSTWRQRLTTLRLTVTNPGAVAMTGIQVHVFIPSTATALVIGTGLNWRFVADGPNAFSYAQDQALEGSPLASVVPAGTAGRVVTFTAGGTIAAGGTLQLVQHLERTSIQSWSSGIYEGKSNDGGEYLASRLYPYSNQLVPPEHFATTPFGFTSAQSAMLAPWAMVTGHAEGSTSDHGISQTQRIGYRDLRHHTYSPTTTVTP